MKVGTMEFEFVMQQFEKDCKPIMFGCHWDRVTKEARERIPVNQFYNDGKVNDLFQAYMLGIAYQEAIVRSTSVEGRE